MSYDIELQDKVTKKVLELPIEHIMTGGTYRVNPDTMEPLPISEAYLNVTYNYAKFYYEATEGDEKFLIEDDDNKGSLKNGGLRALNGKTGLESLSMLDTMINNIKDKYPNLENDGDYWAELPGNAIKPLYQLKVMAELRPDGVWSID